MKIQELKIEDFEFNKNIILDLLIETYQSNFNLSNEQSTILCKEKLETIPEYIIQKNAILLGAFDSDILVGFLWLYKHNYFGELRLHINQVIVSSLFRGKGIGSQLMKETERLAKGNGIKTIDLYVTETNLEAFKMYDSIGFTTERRYMKKFIQEE